MEATHIINPSQSESVNEVVLENDSDAVKKDVLVCAQTDCVEFEDVPHQDDFTMTAEESDHALEAGATLLDGKFIIERQIGAGGFGITYLAKDMYLDRNVVIKECFPDAFCLREGSQVRVNSKRYAQQHRTTVDMFMREARSIAKLRHPNVVGVHQVFEENDTAYMVLEVIHGRDLLDIIEDPETMLTPEQVRDVLVKTLDAMELIHKNDLLHRDVSPDNILLDKWGTPSLIDFGAAREEASKKTKIASKLLVVKDGYSPHEFYIIGGRQDASSDLYALGATMYHLIAGEAPPISQTRVGQLSEGEPDPYVPLEGRFDIYEPAFLRAIDKALSVPSHDRIASARDWLKLIETDSQKVTMVKIPESRNLAKTLSKLVSETNKHVMSEPRLPEPDRAPSELIEPVDVFHPEWVEEFNAETRETARSADELASAADENANGRHRPLLLGTVPYNMRSVGTFRMPFRYNPREILNWVARAR
ncbi:serine/threonine-protein kinase [Yoonia sp.]|uniref:serine/threonine-protein kinase n=1 Tax=Yoonia sp. TaxID=2212373 RepID=UPI0035C7F4CA